MFARAWECEDKRITAFSSRIASLPCLGDSNFVPSTGLPEQPEQKGFSELEIANMSRSSLQQVCRRFKVSDKGRKKDLEARLQRVLRQKSRQAETPKWQVSTHTDGLFSCDGPQHFDIGDSDSESTADGSESTDLDGISFIFRSTDVLPAAVLGAAEKYCYPASGSLYLEDDEGAEGSDDSAELSNLLKGKCQIRSVSYEVALGSCCFMLTVLGENVLNHVKEVVSKATQVYCTRLRRVPAKPAGVKLLADYIMAHLKTPLFQQKDTKTPLFQQVQGWSLPPYSQAAEVAVPMPEATSVSPSKPTVQVHQQLSPISSAYVTCIAAAGNKYGWGSQGGYGDRHTQHGAASSVTRAQVRNLPPWASTGKDTLYQLAFEASSTLQFVSPSPQASSTLRFVSPSPQASSTLQFVSPSPQASSTLQFVSPSQTPLKRLRMEFSP